MDEQNKLNSAYVIIKMYDDFDQQAVDIIGVFTDEKLATDALAKCNEKKKEVVAKENIDADCINYYIGVFPINKPNIF